MLVAATTYTSLTYLRCDYVHSKDNRHSSLSHSWLFSTSFGDILDINHIEDADRLPQREQLFAGWHRNTKGVRA